ncbi:MAG TPA: oxygenase MpaB family protein [Polyangiaceae bacterium]|nr:oxygenase MpaB family protein [Polyangiaceae bacterium]
MVPPFPSDDGLFGPNSVTWRVHANPSMLIGGMRALIIQSLHPLAMAGVAQHSDYRTRGIYRLQRTIRYVLTVTYGDSASAVAAGALVRAVHRRIRGVDPVTGRTYTADDPDTLLWVHCVEVHSFAAAYRAYGGPLSNADRDRYFAESVESAALVGVPRDRVPTSAAEMRVYFERMRPSLCLSQAALDAIRFVVAPPIVGQRLPVAASLRLASIAAVGLIPHHLRALAGIERPWVTDAVLRAGIGAALLPLALALELPMAGRANIARLRREAAAHPFASLEPHSMASASSPSQR